MSNPINSGLSRIKEASLRSGNALNDLRITNDVDGDNSSMLINQYTGEIRLLFLFDGINPITIASTSGIDYCPATIYRKLGGDSAAIESFLLLLSRILRVMKSAEPALTFEQDTFVNLCNVALKVETTK